MTYQPLIDHPVFYNGVLVNTQNWHIGQNGVLITKIDGFFDAYDIRDNRGLNPGRDGEYTQNLFIGGRTLTITGYVSGSTYQDLQTRKRALTAKFIPNTTEYELKFPDPNLVSPSWTYTTSSASFYRVNARIVDSVTFGDTEAPTLQPFSVTLRASDPRIYSDVLQTLQTSAIIATSGFSSPITNPIDAGSASSAGDIVYVNNGTYNTTFIARAYGPVTNPVIEDVGGSWNVTFNGLQLLSGEYVIVDMQNRTALVNNDENRNVFKYIDFTQTTWGTLASGTNTIRYRGVSMTAPAYLEIEVRDAYL